MTGFMFLCPPLGGESSALNEPNYNYGDGQKQKDVDEPT
jgi:hypothetical protein